MLPWLPHFSPASSWAVIDWLIHACAYTRGELAGSTRVARCRLEIIILVIFYIQIAKLKPSPNFPAIQYMWSSSFNSACTCREFGAVFTKDAYCVWISWWAYSKFCHWWSWPGTNCSLCFSNKPVTCTVVHSWVPFLWYALVCDVAPTEWRNVFILARGDLIKLFVPWHGLASYMYSLCGFSQLVLLCACTCTLGGGRPKKEPK